MFSISADNIRLRVSRSSITTKSNLQVAYIGVFIPSKMGTLWICGTVKQAICTIPLLSVHIAPVEITAIRPHHSATSFLKVEAINCSRWRRRRLIGAIQFSNPLHIDVTELFPSTHIICLFLGNNCFVAYVLKVFFKVSLLNGFKIRLRYG